MITPKIMRKLRRYEKLQREIIKVVCEIEGMDPRLEDAVDDQNRWTMSMWLIQSPFYTAAEAADPQTTLI